MLQPLSTALLLLAGAGLGLLFYGGLWLTIRALPNSHFPTAVTLLSFWGRAAVVLVAMVFITAHRWQNAVVCLVGFILGRLLVAHWIPRVPEQKEGIRHGNHA